MNAVNVERSLNFVAEQRQKFCKLEATFRRFRSKDVFCNLTYSPATGGKEWSQWTLASRSCMKISPPKNWNSPHHHGDCFRFHRNSNPSALFDLQYGAIILLILEPVIDVIIRVMPIGAVGSRYSYACGVHWCLDVLF